MPSPVNNGDLSANVCKIKLTGRNVKGYHEKQDTTHRTLFFFAKVQSTCMHV